MKAPKTSDARNWLVYAVALPLLFSCATEASAQKLQITALPQLATNGDYRLRLLSPTGGVFELQVSTNLLQWTSFVTVTNSTGVVDAWDPDNRQYPGRFYRAAPAPTVPIPLLDYVKIPAGTFVMGSPPGEVVGWTAAWGETQHTVTLTHDFYMSAYEVTQSKYLALMGYNPSFFTTQDFLTNPIPPDLQRPVDSVSWYDATNYCWQLTQSERAAGRLPQGWEYRLPTEAEWEYACRAGTTTTFTYGTALRSGMANFDGRGEYEGGVGASYNPDGIFLERTTAVGSYEANAFGLYDMHGNVWEWCLDRLGTYPTDYPTESVTDPQGPITGPGRVIRGGCLANEAAYCRSATRGIANPAQRANVWGFRPVLAQITAEP